MPEQKIYPISRSPLYQCRNKRKLATLLGISPKDFKVLPSESNYRVRLTSLPGKKPRLIEEPINQLKNVHRKIHQFLSRIESPSHLYSGKKGLSSISNALHHARKAHSLTVDIEKFFGNCRSEYVFRFFHYQMMMSEDVAWLLAEISTYQGHVPTGSPLSQDIAYWAYSRTFDAISELATERGIVFSLYVDDMSFTFSQPIARTLHLAINAHLKAVGLHLKSEKDRHHSASHYKVITGVAISPTGEFRVPNKMRRKILDKLEANPDLEATEIRVLNSIFGSLTHARQIEPSIFEPQYQCVKAAIRKRKNQPLSVSH